jgi:hypothetical protein
MRSYLAALGPASNDRIGFYLEWRTSPTFWRSTDPPESNLLLGHLALLLSFAYGERYLVFLFT